MKMSKKMNVFIIGSGHSGSTLLDMLLGGHSCISALGEAHRLYFAVRSKDKYHHCTCGKHISDCKFWKSVEKELKRRTNGDEFRGFKSLYISNPKYKIYFNNEMKYITPLRYHGKSLGVRFNEMTLIIGSKKLRNLLGWLSKEVRRDAMMAKHLIFLYDAVRVAQNTPIIIDSTKNPGTFKKIYIQNKKNTYFIELIRDGRAVCNSRMKREGIDMFDAAKIWKKEQIKRIASMITIPMSKTIRIYYEKLASNPKDTLKNICNYLEIDFENEMMNFRGQRHNLGGNLMRFKSSKRKIKLDEAWRGNLSKKELSIFSKIAGGINRRYGYY